MSLRISEYGPASWGPGRKGMTTKSTADERRGSKDEA